MQNVKIRSGQIRSDQKTEVYSRAERAKFFMCMCFYIWDDASNIHSSKTSQEYISERFIMECSCSLIPKADRPIMNQPYTIIKHVGYSRIPIESH